MADRRLPAGITEQLRYYVYLYVDPETNKPFYVGKGYGDRVYAHLHKIRDCAKSQYIHQLRDKGLEPRIEILMHGLDEETAFRVEGAAIDLLNIHNLTNEQRGWRSGTYGRMPFNELIAFLQPEEVDIDDPVILIRINQMYHFGISEQELYEATRGVWVIGERRNLAMYAFAVFDGLVREVYTVGKWHPGGTTKYHTRDAADVDAPDRWEFTGKVAKPAIRDKYLLKSVTKYLPANSQNPIKYVNC